MDTLLTYQVFSHSAETHLQVFALLVIGFALGRFLPFLLRPIFRRIGGASGQTVIECLSSSAMVPFPVHPSTNRRLDGEWRSKIQRRAA